MRRGLYKTLWLLSYLLATSCREHGYHLAKTGIRGNDVLVSQETSSKIFCAGICNQDTNCCGFNWITQSEGKLCQTLYNLINVTTDSDCNLYSSIEFDNFWSKSMGFACPLECFTSNPLPATAQWVHECNPIGQSVILGIGGSTSQNMDQLLCADLGSLATLGTALDVNGNTDCSVAMNGPAVAVAVWSNNAFYISPSQVAFKCRLFISGLQIDPNRCTLPQYQLQDISHFGVQNPNLKSFLCPIDMVAVSFYLTAGKFTLKCCLIY
ncbi:hypothetical protein SK128_008920 [Halocaridina rubra]|uniref:Apple domain-containing protein n=1 Tax=Halocaridina rubra TaxID=373956 RepID=A0AAN8ZTN1_HALRR